MAKEDISNAELLYPFYLDTDMTMAFAAALAGGVTLRSEDVDSVGQQREKAGELKAGLRLLDIVDLGGRKSTSRKEVIKSESRMIRHHTEASIFITLFNELRRLGSIFPPDVPQLKTGQITSIETGPATAPLLRVVNQILRLLDITSPSASSKVLADEDGSTEELRKLFRSLKSDLELSGMTDIVVRREEGVSVVLTLDNRFITDQALELLHTSTFQVVGKVTQIWSQDSDFVNLYRRSVLSLVPALPSAMGWLVLAWKHRSAT